MHFILELKKIEECNFQLLKNLTSYKNNKFKSIILKKKNNSRIYSKSNQTSNNTLNRNT